MKTFLIATTAILLASTAAVAGHHGDKDGKMCEKKMAKKFEKMDTDKDGAISKDEFITYKTSKFEKMDANNDGKLTMEEKKAYKEAKYKKKKEMKKDHDHKDHDHGDKKEKSY